MRHHLDGLVHGTNPHSATCLGNSMAVKGSAKEGEVEEGREHVA